MNKVRFVSWFLYETVCYSSLICDKSQPSLKTDSGCTAVMVVCSCSVSQQWEEAFCSLLSCTLVTTTSLLLPSLHSTHTQDWSLGHHWTLASFSVQLATLCTILIVLVCGVTSPDKRMWSYLLVISTRDQICACVQWSRPGGSLRGQRQWEGGTLNRAKSKWCEVWRWQPSF